MLDANGNDITNPNGTDLGNVNPFRWKGFYYDNETDWYYVDGRYYDPNICQYIDADAPENLLFNSAVINGLNRYGITVDNAVALVGALYNIFTQTKLYRDYSYEYDKNLLDKIMDWIPIIQWALVAVAVVITMGFGLFATPEMFAALLAVEAKAAVSGFVLGGIAGGLASMQSGGNVFMGMLQGAVQGALTGFALAAITFAIMTGVRAVINAVKAANAARYARRVVADTLAAQDAAVQPKSLSDYDARVWYKEHVSEIDNLLDNTKSLETQARQAHAIRNHYKVLAREAMIDRAAAARFDLQYPTQNFGYYVGKYSATLSGDTLYKEIIDASMRTNKIVDKTFNL